MTSATPAHFIDRGAILAIGIAMLLGVGLVLSAPVYAQEPLRPLIVPLPEAVAGAEQSVISLNGTWGFTMDPPERFWRNAVDPSSWEKVQVPGELWMQGFQIERDVEYPYKRRVEIPADFAGKCVFLRFDGIYSRARVWVNGQKAGEHYGGFTSWNLDITDYVTPGEAAWITVGVTDLTSDPSFASFYAGRYYTENTERAIGGILRPVTLFAVPPDYVTRLHVATDLDAAYEDAVLKVNTGVNFHTHDRAELRLRLIDPSGDAVSIQPDVIELTRAQPERTIEIPVEDPRLWDAEHPYLYRLEAALWVDGKRMERLSKSIGFREIERIGPNVFINGRAIKLHGVNRHSAHPLRGRAYAPEAIRKDVLLYKKANINYIRTSHYPAPPLLLKLADKYGLYVEEEMAIVWIDHGAAHGRPDSLHLRRNPAYRDWFVSSIAEAIERDRSHPSIIIWSLTNESTIWGPNFEAELNYARQADSTRLIKIGHNHYSNPDVPKAIDSAWQFGLDIDSYHYPYWKSDYRWDFDTESLPQLFDEYAHVPTYNFPTLIRDPNVRTYWGRSLKVMWDRMYAANGTLGAAIWSGIDDVFLAPDGVYGYGRWGIIDGWRRKKPEHWHTKKAYSPVRITDTTLDNPGASHPLHIPVENRFNHTNLSELRITWRIGADSGRVEVDLPPRERGVLEILARDWQDGDVVHLRFVKEDPHLTYTVDRYALTVGEVDRSFPAPQGPAPALGETDSTVIVTGDEFRLVFSKETGLIAKGVYDGEVLLTGGPHLNLSPYDLTGWTLERLTTSRAQDAAVVKISGSYQTVGADFVLRISGDGVITTTYTIYDPPEPTVYAEYGVTFDVSPAIDRLAWARDGLWSVYPDDHIGRNKGTALKVRPGEALEYREKPTWPWALDMNDFHLLGKGSEGFGMTNDYRSLKGHIYWATAYHRAMRNGVRVESDGTHAVRMDKRAEATWVDDRAPSVSFSGAWTQEAGYADYQGNNAYTAYRSTLTYTGEAGAAATYTFEGGYIAWIGPRAPHQGKADIYIDGRRLATVDTYARVRRSEQVLFEKSGLGMGTHTIRIVASGAKNDRAGDVVIAVDAFSTTEDPAAVYELHVNRKWSYDLGWGNYSDPFMVSDGFTDTVRLRLVRRSGKQSIAEQE